MLPDVRQVLAAGLADGLAGRLGGGPGDIPGDRLGGGPGDRLGDGALLVVMGTVAPAAMTELAVELAPRGVRLVDAPVSGGDVGAIDATLSIMVGGNAGDVTERAPVFAALGNTITHLGPLGSGQIAKACNQIVVAATLAALGEALTLARHGELDPQLLLNVLAGGLAASRVLDVKGNNLLSRDFTPGDERIFSSRIWGLRWRWGAVYERHCRLPRQWINFLRQCAGRGTKAKTTAVSSR